VKFQIFIILFLFGIKSYSQDLQGTWLMIRVERNQKVDEPYILTRFKPDGKMYFRNFEIAEWKKSGNQLIFNSKFDPKFSGKARILKLDNQELVYQKGSDKYRYIRYDHEQLMKDTIYQKLTGVWQLYGKQNRIYYLGTNHEFSEKVFFIDGTMSTKGEWYYLPEQKAIVIQADIEALKGKSQILFVNKDILKLKNKEVYEYTLYRKKYVEKPEESLTFTFEELEQTNSDEHDLPWSDEALLGFLPSVETLYYSRETFEKDIYAYYEEDIELDVEVDTGDKRITFTTYRFNDEERIPENKTTKAFLENTYNRFFPQEDIGPFRVMSNDAKLTIDEKDYYCTVVEGFNGDDRVKYWMINDMPGVYARVIRQNDDNDYYVVYQWKGL